MDGLACLAIAVLMLRTFLVEGYMISTGSMAPTLYGYHKRVVCPTCGDVFARGVAFDGASALADDENALFGGGHHAVCPNCGQAGIDVAKVPRNHGDQLLVLKHAYEFRSPERWEVIVFRNPNQPTQAFVKRVVGLPGERVQIIEGDVYANGEICRKSLETQRAMRIPVFESEHAPRGPTFLPRWEGDAQWDFAGSVWRFQPERRGEGAKDISLHDEVQNAGAGWGPGQEQARTPDSQGLTETSATVTEAELSWLSYHHRVRDGGGHETAVRLRGLPLGFRLPATPYFDLLRFDPDPIDPTAGILTVIGTLSDEWRRQLEDLSADPDYQAAIAELAERSRLAPITDVYAYNRSLGIGAYPVRDLMIAFMLRLEGHGRFAVELTDGRERLQLVADTATGTLSLTRSSTNEILRSAPLPAALLAEGGALIEMSVMDRQALVAVDGELPFAPWAFEETDEIEPPTSRPVRLGAAGVTAIVSSLAIYRDVYYTPGKSRNGVAAPFALGEDEFFVLGDNSPVSLDSRSWPEGSVPASLLLGKPFLVHLPSRPGTLRFGDRRLTVRIPDFGRIRYIR
jgi:type IV secretory pathway protease TraF